LNILVIAAHPDDEVLGMGGTIKKFSKLGNNIKLCVISEGASAQYSDKEMIDVRRESCAKAGKILGIQDFKFLNFPDAKLDSIPQLEINIEIEKIISEFNPEIVFTISNGDLSKDHQKVFESTLVATRPINSKIRKVLAYELPGPRIEQFQPTIFEDISSEINSKNEAMLEYESEMEQFPHPRSIESIESLAKYRGSQSGLKFAEAFRLIYEINQEKD